MFSRPVRPTALTAVQLRVSVDDEGESRRDDERAVLEQEATASLVPKRRNRSPGPWAALVEAEPEGDERAVVEVDSAARSNEPPSTLTSTACG